MPVSFPISVSSLCVCVCVSERKALGFCPQKKFHKVSRKGYFIPHASGIQQNILRLIKWLIYITESPPLPALGNLRNCFSFFFLNSSFKKRSAQ